MNWISKLVIEHIARYLDNIKDICNLYNAVRYEINPEIILEKINENDYMTVKTCKTCLRLVLVDDEMYRKHRNIINNERFPYKLNVDHTKGIYCQGGCSKMLCDACAMVTICCGKKVCLNYCCSYRKHPGMYYEQAYCREHAPSRDL